MSSLFGFCSVAWSCIVPAADFGFACVAWELFCLSLLVFDDLGLLPSPQLVSRSLDFLGGGG